MTPSEQAMRAAEAINSLLENAGACSLPKSYISHIAAIIDKEVGGWRDVSTAPKDGTPIWAYWCDDQVRMQWLNTEGYHGWIFSDQDMPDMCPDPMPPTHWMPLPPPPCPQ